MRTGCCCGCVPPKRTPTCHTYCEEYIRWKADRDAQAEAQRKVNACKGGIYAQKSAVVSRAIKKHGRKL